MDGDLGGWTLKPDQMQVINPLLIIILIPIFESTLYPLFKKFNILQKPLNKMIVGGSLAALAFVLSALVELAIKPTESILPVAGEAQIRIFNTFNCPMIINANDEFVSIDNQEIKPLEAYEKLHIQAQGNKLFTLRAAPGTGCPENLAEETFPVEYAENEVSWIYDNHQMN